MKNRRDELLLERLHDQYKSSMIHKAYRLLMDYQLAEDAVQESFLRLMSYP